MSHGVLFMGAQLNGKKDSVLSSPGCFTHSFPAFSLWSYRSLCSSGSRFPLDHVTKEIQNDSDKFALQPKWECYTDANWLVRFTVWPWCDNILRLSLHSVLKGQGVQLGLWDLEDLFNRQKEVAKIGYLQYLHLCMYIKTCCTPLSVHRNTTQTSVQFRNIHKSEIQIWRG